MTDDPFLHLDAVYLMGALDEDERVAYEAHLAVCDTCRAGLDDARGVLDGLSGSNESALDADVPYPEAILPRLLAQGRRTRVRRRVAVSVLAAAAVALLVVVLGSSTPDQASPRAVPMVALHPSPITASAALRSTAWGTEVTLTCGYAPGASLPPGYRYALTVHERNGTASQLGTWQLNDSRTITFTAGTALQVAQIQSIDIADSDGTSLLELTPTVPPLTPEP